MARGALAAPCECPVARPPMEVHRSDLRHLLAVRVEFCEVSSRSLSHSDKMAVDPAATAGAKDGPVHPAEGDGKWMS